MDKSFFVKLIVSLSLITMFTACSDSSKIQEDQTQATNVLKMLLNVEGMTCEGCEKGIEGSLSKLPGVVNVKASHIDRTTVVDFDDTKISAAAIKKEILESGYKIVSVPEGSSDSSKYENGK